MMFKVEENTIYLTRGDSAVLELEITSKSGEAYQIKENDEILFTVKKNTNSNNILLQKRINNSKIKLEPEDTTGLPYGQYFYDIQLKNGSYVDTIITPSAIHIEPEVTF